MKTLGKPTLKCLRCGYNWTPRGDVEPERIKSCPDCKHRKWREPKPPEDLPRVFENLLWQSTEKPRAKLELVPTEKPREELGGSREYDQYRKAKLRETMSRPKKLHCSECGAPVFSASPDDEKAGVMCLECSDNITELQPTEKPRPKPEHSCHDCGEPAEYPIEATDLNFTDQGTEYITYDEWFCAEHYQERTKNLP